MEQPSCGNPARHKRRLSWKVDRPMTPKTPDRRHKVDQKAALNAMQDGVVNEPLLPSLPLGSSWRAPELTGVQRLPARASLIPFPDAEAARLGESFRARHRTFGCLYTLPGGVV